jgi:hypothetical protein
MKKLKFSKGDFIMLDKESLVPLIISLEVVGCVLLSIWGFSTAQYYKGRNEAKRESEREIFKLKNELAKKNKKLAKKFGL